MSLAKVTQVKGLALAVPGDDIDTDRIIPARFLRCVTPSATSAPDRTARRATTR